MPTPDVLATLADLVRLNSINTAYEDGTSEAGVAAYLREFFRTRGIETWEQEVFPGRSNLIARVPGRDPRRRVILEAHMDTVSAKGMTIPPFEPTISGGRLHGRGSCDTKAGLAGMAHAVASLAADRFTPPCDVWLAAVVDEEFSYRGVVKLCEGLTAHAAIVAEPTELRLVVAINAIDHMARLILAIEPEHAALATRPHPFLGPATGNVGVIRGGVQVNFVPDSCVIEIDRRLLPGEKVDAILARYQQLINGLAARHPGFAATMEVPPLLVDEALETAIDSPVTQTAAAVLRGLGLNGDPCGVPYGSDASKLSRQGVPSLVFGPGSIDRAHAAVEYVETDQVLQAFEFYREFVRRFE
jgi:acetylornithine deacetylase/succinyl-diaminopimelate desuccinylase-like protein